MEPFVARLGLYRDGGGALVLDYANFTGAGTLSRLFDGEVGSLTLPQQFEHPSPHCAAMEEMLDSLLIADEAETFVDQETRDRTACHYDLLRYLNPAATATAQRRAAHRPGT